LLYSDNCVLMNPACVHRPLQIELSAFGSCMSTILYIYIYIYIYILLSIAPMFRTALSVVNWQGIRYLIEQTFPFRSILVVNIFKAFDKRLSAFRISYLIAHSSLVVTRDVYMFICGRRPCSRQLVNSFVNLCLLSADWRQWVSDRMRVTAAENEHLSNKQCTAMYMAACDYDLAIYKRWSMITSK